MSHTWCGSPQHFNRNNCVMCELERFARLYQPLRPKLGNVLQAVGVCL
jgi:hypothetical protein